MVGARGGGGWVGAALAAGALLGVAAAGCQTYDFEPVLPVTLAQTTFRNLAYQRALKANLFVLVDRSGSMDTRIVPGCTTGCATRISEVRSAMGGFLAGSGTLARMGLAFFPGSSSASSCAPTASVEVPLPAPTTDDTGTDAALQASADAMRAAIAGATPAGGTPTAASVAFVGALPGLNSSDGRDDYLLLLTDGLPNCNGANPNNVCACGTQPCAAEASCKCTQLKPGGGSSCLDPTYCSTLCLDQDASVAAISALYDRHIKTIVIGFGTDTAGGDARAVLTAMAAAGGFSNDFIQVGNAAQLTAVLDALAPILTRNACQFQLTSQPSDPSLLAVLVDGVGVAPGPDSWSYTATPTGGTVTFAEASAVCAHIKSVDQSHPVVVEIRIVQRL